MEFLLELLPRVYKFLCLVLCKEMMQQQAFNTQGQP